LASECKSKTRQQGYPESGFVGQLR
jgi:hypothetical protein